MNTIGESWKESDTFTYLYDKDTELMRAEKGALLKYMQKEVVQNQEFLDRISELEGQMDFLSRENQ